MTGVSCDVCVLVPLPEEFEVFQRVFDTEPLEKTRNIQYYDVETPGKEDVVAVLLGEMGQSPAAQLTERALESMQPDLPELVVLVGIGGALTDDLKLGDVVVASEVNRYQSRSKAVEADDGYRMQYGGNSWRISPRLRTFLTHLNYTATDQYEAWQEQVAQFRGSEHVPQAESLRRADPTYELAHVASGETVGAADEYITDLLKLDRNLAAIEMEAGGVCRASHWRQRTDALVLRGISDFADDRKKRLDETNDGIWREYGMYTATALLETLLNAGVVEQVTEGELSAARVQTAGQSPRLVRSPGTSLDVRPTTVNGLFGVDFWSGVPVTVDDMTFTLQADGESMEVPVSLVGGSSLDGTELVSDTTITFVAERPVPADTDQLRVTIEAASERWMETVELAVAGQPTSDGWTITGRSVTPDHNR